MAAAIMGTLLGVAQRATEVFLTYVPIKLVVIRMVYLYDSFVYKPLETYSVPLISKIPRSVKIGGRDVTVFSVVTVQIVRTSLCIPIAYALKHGWYWVAFLFVIFHDYLDHLDGIVSKIQGKQGYKPNPKIESFLDSFCDKVINVVNLWSLIMTTNYDNMSYKQTWFYILLCSAIICYEILLGIVRVDDYYPAQSAHAPGFARPGGAGSLNLASSMEGKLKEKLESLGIGALCLAQPGVYENFTGYVGIIFLVSCVWLNHMNLSHKLKARAISSAPVAVTEPSSPRKRAASLVTMMGEQDPDFAEQEGDENLKYDKVYSIGCFDLFHDGHVKLMKNMRKYGRTLIVGVHDDESIYLLKNRYPIDNTVKRVRNVKRYADIVYVIPSTDPSPYLEGAIDRKTASKSVYIRGNDMPNFPGRSLVESIMSLEFLPYTEGVSSTMLREKLKERQKQQGDLQDSSHWIRYGHEWIKAADTEWLRYGDEYIKMA